MNELEASAALLRCGRGMGNPGDVGASSLGALLGLSCERTVRSNTRTRNMSASSCWLDLERRGRGRGRAASGLELGFVGRSV